MSFMKRMGKSKTAVVVGAGVVGLSMLWAIAPAAAAAPSRTTLSSSTPSIGAGSIGKLKAVVKQTSGTLLPTGQVTFREGTTATSPAVAPAVTLATVNGVPTAKLDVPGLSVGTHTFIATYAGSTAFNPSTSLTTRIVVTAVAKSDTTTTGSTTTPTVVPGEEVKLKAVVKPVVAGPNKPTGTVTFSEGGTALAPAVPLALIGTVMTAKLSLTNLSNGNHSIIATYSGSGAFNVSASAAIAVSVGKAAAVCALTAPAASDPVTLKTRFAFTVKPASGTIAPTGTGTWTIDAGAQPPQALVLSYSTPASTGRDSLSPVFAVNGTHTVSVTYDGDVTYTGCTASKTIITPYTP